MLQAVRNAGESLFASAANVRTVRFEIDSEYEANANCDANIRGESNAASHVVAEAEICTKPNARVEC